ncbi:hypothetical protein A2U01_0040386 [Trifolium medium]|uniref:Uncharacterized protein n=1 Tax=Trifolium medium TaxID=97028 RepID=A0A392Q683_9FABA|nr:hypothetical protein [Trifolium medium]
MEHLHLEEEDEIEIPEEEIVKAREGFNLDLCLPAWWGHSLPTNRMGSGAEGGGAPTEHKRGWKMAEDRGIVINVAHT